MKDQSKIPKSLCITFTTHKLTIFYDGFLLTEQIMVNFSVQDKEIKERIKNSR